jgi:hypothetical protein
MNRILLDAELQSKLDKIIEYKELEKAFCTATNEEERAIAKEAFLAILQEFA